MTLSVKGLKVQNKGWTFTDDPDAPEEEIRIRGYVSRYTCHFLAHSLKLPLHSPRYRMTKGETMEIVVTEPGSYTVDSTGAVQKA